MFSALQLAVPVHYILTAFRRTGPNVCEFVKLVVRVVALLTAVFLYYFVSLPKGYIVGVSLPELEESFGVSVGFQEGTCPSLKKSRVF